MDRCWAMTRAYNEERLIAYWVRHYETFCERVVVYVDMDTNDATAEIAERLGAHVYWVPSLGLDDLAFVTFAQEHYRAAAGRAQWVCWTDVDELLYAPNLGERLDMLRAAGVTCPHVAGYSMVADAPPRGTGQIYDEITRGFPSVEYSKVCVFDPELDVFWSPGKHEARVVGNVVRDDPGDGASSDPLKLLHYRYLGEAWCRARNARNWARIDERNRSMMHGRETSPGWGGDYGLAWYAQQAARAQEVV